MNLLSINNSLAKILGLHDSQTGYVLLSPAGIKIQIFITFAYVYHYLNWFSKTTVIGWHKSITNGKLILILSIWTIAVSLYFYDFRVAFIALLFLSFLHVVLEFPLNFVTFKEIGKSIIGKQKSS